jgi:hypothetical protein
VFVAAPEASAITAPREHENATRGGILRTRVARATPPRKGPNFDSTTHLAMGRKKNKEKAKSKSKSKSKTKTKRTADDADVADSARHRREREAKGQAAAQLQQLRAASRPTAKKDTGASCSSSGEDSGDGSSSNSSDLPPKHIKAGKDGKVRGKGKDKAEKVTFSAVRGRYNGVVMALATLGPPFVL